MTGADLLRRGIAALAGIDGAARDARLLLAAAMGIAPGRVTLVLGDPVSAEVRDRFDAMIGQRAGRMPVSQILGFKAFWQGEFAVTHATLSPRPETETLVEQALAQSFSRVLDLGTGTGCIAISLLVARPDANGIATDISPDALQVAKGNAARHGVADRLSLVRSDWFSDVSGLFDLIVSNPPYIAASEMPALPPEVRNHEPALALSDMADGLTAYRRIAAGCRDHLLPGGRILLEIGPTQAEPVGALLTAAGLSDITIFHDLDDRDRVVAARQPD